LVFLQVIRRFTCSTKSFCAISFTVGNTGRVLETLLILHIGAFFTFDALVESLMVLITILDFGDFLTLSISISEVLVTFAFNTHVSFRVELFAIVDSVLVTLSQRQEPVIITGSTLVHIRIEGLAVFDFVLFTGVQVLIMTLFTNVAIVCVEIKLSAVLNSVRQTASIGVVVVGLTSGTLVHVADVTHAVLLSVQFTIQVVVQVVAFVAIETSILAEVEVLTVVDSVGLTLLGVVDEVPGVTLDARVRVIFNNFTVGVRRGITVTVGSIEIVFGDTRGASVGTCGEDVAVPCIVPFTSSIVVPKAVFTCETFVGVGVEDLTTFGVEFTDIICGVEVTSVLAHETT
jgi:hypothetical protein